MHTHLKTLEIRLHQHEVRTDLTQLKDLLHPSFTEIGYSGKRYDLAAITANLAAEEPPTHTIWSQGYEFTEYTENTVQLLYQSALMDDKGELSRHAMRTSIWVKYSNHWQMIYHQGTPTKSFAQEHEHANL